METRAFSGVVGSVELPTVALSTPELEEQIALLSASIAVATWRLLMLIAELDRRNAWQQWGVLSCAHWLNWKCGIDIGAAREKVRVARALESLPLVSDALARGGAELLEGPRDHARRHAREPGLPADDRAPRHGLACRETGARLPQRGTAARGRACPQHPRATCAALGLRGRRLDDDHRAPARRAGRAGGAGDSRGGRCAVARARRRRPGVR